MDMLLEMRVESICNSLEAVGSRPLGALAELDDDSLLDKLSTSARIQISESLIAFMHLVAKNPSRVIAWNPGVGDRAFETAQRRLVRVAKAADFREACRWLAQKSERASAEMREMIDLVKSWEDTTVR